MTLLDNVKKSQPYRYQEVRPQTAPDSRQSDNSEAQPDNPVFGSDRTKNQKNMLTFRKANNHWRHIPYSQILMIDDREGINVTIFTPMFSVVIKGEKLRPIAEMIKQGSLSYVQESSKDNPFRTEEGTSVYSISFEVPQIPQ